MTGYRDTGRWSQQSVAHRKLGSAASEFNCRNHFGAC